MWYYVIRQCGIWMGGAVYVRIVYKFLIDLNRGLVYSFKSVLCESNIWGCGRRGRGEVALHRVSPRSLRRKFTSARQPLLLATSHRSLHTASHSLRNKYILLLLCHSSNLLTMNAHAFLLIFYVIRVFTRPRPHKSGIVGTASLFYVYRVASFIWCYLNYS